MVDILRSSSNNKFVKNEDDDQIKGEYYGDDEEDADGDDALTDQGEETTDNEKNADGDEALTDQGAETTDNEKNADGDDALTNQGAKTTDNKKNADGDDALTNQGAKTTDNEKIADDDDALTNQGAKTADNKKIADGDDALANQGAKTTDNKKNADGDDALTNQGAETTDNKKNADGDDALTNQGAKTADKSLHDIAPVVRTPSANTYSSRHNVDDKQNADDNPGSSRKRETSNKVLRVNVPVVQTLPMRTSSKTDLNIESNTNGDNLKAEPHSIEAKRVDLIFDKPGERKVEETIDCKSLNEYLEKHERFLKFIDRTRQLSLNERKQLNIQKEELKRLKKKLAGQIEENDHKRLYEKLKENNILLKRRAFLQRRIEETRLKETRRPRVQTTFHLSIKEQRSKSQMTQKSIKANRIDPSSFSDVSQPKSVVSYMSDTDSAPVSRFQNHVECQTDIEHRLDKFDKHFKGYSDDIGKNLKDLIVQFVEHSKRTWINE